MPMDPEEISRRAAELTGSLCSRTASMDPVDAVGMMSNAVAGWLAVQITGMPTQELRQQMGVGFVGNLQEATIDYVTGIDAAAVPGDQPSAVGLVGGLSRETLAGNAVVSHLLRQVSPDMEQAAGDEVEVVDLDRLIANGPAH